MCLMKYNILLLLLLVIQFNFINGFKWNSIMVNKKLGIKMQIDSKSKELVGFIEPMRKGIQASAKPGKTVQYGVLFNDLDQSTIPSIDEQKKLREQAAKDLINIDMTERQRRLLVAQVVSTVTAIFYLSSLYFHFSIFVRAIPLYFGTAFALGYYKSYENGL
mmetsp:Transcript_22685/g.20606  ORF Transcript_22685/g.20606 Transcript_22685/m.20606 type:complete len:162 (-) Transcript_22685:192-677(-)